MEEKHKHDYSRVMGVIYVFGKERAERSIWKCKTCGKKIWSMESETLVPQRWWQLRFLTRFSLIILVCVSLFDLLFFLLTGSYAVLIGGLTYPIFWFATEKILEQRRDKDD